MRRQWFGQPVAKPHRLDAEAIDPPDGSHQIAEDVEQLLASLRMPVRLSALTWQQNVSHSSGVRPLTT